MIWPENKRIAIMMAFDVDGETLWFQRGDGNRDHLTNLSRGWYDTRQGLPRILRMLEEHEIKATFFVPAYMAETYPEHVREIVRLGHEIAYHGYLHEECSSGASEEAAIMEKSERIIREITGKQVIGHRSPGGAIQDYSLELFLKRGYIYSSNWRNNDGPFIHNIEGKQIPLVELPKDSIFDDTAYDMHTEDPPPRHNLRSAKEMVQVWKDEFDALAAEGRMINFVLHPQFIGRPSRVKALSDLISYMKREGAWFETNENVARYVLQQNGL